MQLLRKILHQTAKHASSRPWAPRVQALRLPTLPKIVRTKFQPEETFEKWMRRTHVRRHYYKAVATLTKNET